MLIRIPQVLNAQQVKDCRTALETADWSDGRATAGYLSARVKENAQVPEGHPVARRLGDMILDALDKNQLFISAALPLKVVPPPKAERLDLTMRVAPGGTLTAPTVLSKDTSTN